MEITLSSATVVKIVQVEMSCNLVVIFHIDHANTLKQSFHNLLDEEESEYALENIHSAIDWALQLLKRVHYLSRMT